MLLSVAFSLGIIVGYTICNLIYAKPVIQMYRDAYLDEIGRQKRSLDNLSKLP